MEEAWSFVSWGRSRSSIRAVWSVSVAGASVARLSARAWPDPTQLGPPGIGPSPSVCSDPPDTVWGSWIDPWAQPSPAQFLFGFGLDGLQELRELSDTEGSPSDTIACRSQDRFLGRLPLYRSSSSITWVRRKCHRWRVPGLAGDIDDGDGGAALGRGESAPSIDAKPTGHIGHSGVFCEDSLDVRLGLWGAATRRLSRHVSASRCRSRRR